MLNLEVSKRKMPQHENHRIAKLFNFE